MDEFKEWLNQEIALVQKKIDDAQFWLDSDQHRTYSAVRNKLLEVKDVFESMEKEHG